MPYVVLTLCDSSKRLQHARSSALMEQTQKYIMWEAMPILISRDFLMLPERQLPLAIAFTFCPIRME